MEAPAHRCLLPLPPVHHLHPPLIPLLLLALRVIVIRVIITTTTTRVRVITITITQVVLLLLLLWGRGLPAVEITCECSHDTVLVAQEQRVPQSSPARLATSVAPSSPNICATFVLRPRRVRRSSGRRTGAAGQEEEEDRAAGLARWASADLPWKEKIPTAAAAAVTRLSSLVAGGCQTAGITIITCQSPRGVKECPSPKAAWGRAVEAKPRRPRPGRGRNRNSNSSPLRRSLKPEE